MKHELAALTLAVLGLFASHACAQAKVTAFEVSLTWDAPVSSPDPVSGYNAYRAPTGSTSFQQLSGALITATAYSDLTVASATTYDYVVRSVDAQGQTSLNSNTATVPVPAIPPAPAKPTVTFNP